MARPITAIKRDSKGFVVSRCESGAFGTFHRDRVVAASDVPLSPAEQDIADLCERVLELEAQLDPCPAPG